MAPTEADPRRALRTIAHDLTVLRERLQELLDGLPPAPEGPEDLEAPWDSWDPGYPGDNAESPLADFRSRIECVLADSLLCRARHKSDNAESRIMPSRPARIHATA